MVKRADSPPPAKNNISFDVLQSLGMTQRQQAIYLAALELGESLQVPLAKKAKIKRTTLRELLPDLLNRGILQQKIVGKRKLVVASDPRELVLDLEEKTKQAKEALPQLLAMQNILTNKPEIRFFEGIEGLKQVYQLTLDLGLTMYCFVNTEQMYPELRQWLAEYYIPEKLRRKIWIYNIMTAGEESKSLMPEHGYRENKYIPKEQYPFEMEIVTFGDYVTFHHFRKTEEPSGIIIKSKAAAETMLSIHKLIWNNIK